ncbi:MAG: ATPase [Gemmatales bacterium]|nr:MAG: ATPase [Gemmatales bacterium]
MRWSIRYQLLVPLVVLLVGVVAGISVWTAFSSVKRTREQIEERMRRSARVINGRDFPLTEQVLKMTKELSGADFLVVQKQGRRVTTLETADDDTPAVAVIDRPDDLVLGSRIEIGKESYFCSGIRIRRHRPDEAADLFILYPVSLWRDALWQAILPSVVVGGVGLLASLILATVLAQRLGRRIQELGQRTKLIAAGDFSPMELPGRNDELRDLGESVNDMAEQLAELQNAVRKSERLQLLGQLGSGLAHQLRNGVAGAKLAVQLHLRECQNGGDDESLAVALRQLALVESNLKCFLDLGRSEEVRREPCRLHELIDHAVGLLAPNCRHSHIDLRWQADQSVNIEGDATQLGHLFLNVIGNAVEAAGPNGTVEVLLHDGEQCATIDVIDSGPGPNADVADRLFEPFVTGKREGVGLGLAVARRVAEAHGGVIDWQRWEGKTRFRIRLPKSASADPNNSHQDGRNLS